VFHATDDRVYFAMRFPGKPVPPATGEEPFCAEERANPARARGKTSLVRLHGGRATCEPHPFR
jgi:hypothetical protein